MYVIASASPAPEASVAGLSCGSTGEPHENKAHAAGERKHEVSHDLEREPGMVNLSDLIIYNPQVGSFPGLLELVAKAAEDGARFVNFDVKPDFPDTPRSWQTDIERVFALGGRYLRGRS